MQISDASERVSKRCDRVTEMVGAYVIAGSEGAQLDNEAGFASWLIFVRYSGDCAVVGKGGSGVVVFAWPERKVHGCSRSRFRRQPFPLACCGGSICRDQASCGACGYPLRKHLSKTPVWSGSTRGAGRQWEEG